VQRQNAQPATLFVFVFLFGRIVHRTIRIRPNSLKPQFGTPLVIIIIKKALTRDHIALVVTLEIHVTVPYK